VDTVEPAQRINVVEIGCLSNIETQHNEGPLEHILVSCYYRVVNGHGSYKVWRYVFGLDFLLMHHLICSQYSFNLTFLIYCVSPILKSASLRKRTSRYIFCPHFDFSRKCLCGKGPSLLFGLNCAEGRCTTSIMAPFTKYFILLRRSYLFHCSALAYFSFFSAAGGSILVISGGPTLRFN
jgi:hypothetical protein